MIHRFQRACQAIACLGFFAALVGCGGGGGGTNGGGGSLTDQQRGAVLAAAATRFDSLQGLDPAAANQQMAQYLQQQPEFEAAGVSDDGCAWGRFKDGRLAIFVNNRKPPAGKAPGAPPRLRTRAAGPPSNLPMEKSVYLANALGASWTSSDTYLPVWFRDHDYTVSTGANPSDLKGVVSAGLFYIDAHGGSGQWPDGSKAFGVWTREVRTAAGDVAYKDDLDNRRLAYMYANSYLDAATNKWVPEWHYAITARFVMDEMSFSQNSLVFINACSSDEPVFRAACLAKGASVYVGWSKPVDNDLAISAADKLLDRLLGENLADPIPSPNQRSFDWQSVYAWMQENGYDIGAAAGGCYLKISQGSSGGSAFGEFAPSIAFVWAHEYEKKLYIYGIFGDNPGSDGKVTVGGAPAAVQEWAYDGTSQMDRIVCDLPFEGAGSAGDVQVTVREHKSNARQLSMFKGWFKLTHDTGDGRQYTVDHYLRFRVDLQSLRIKPGESPKHTPVNPQRVFADQDSYADYEASGIWVMADGSVEWTGKDTLLNNIDGSSNPRGFIASIRFDPAAHEGHLTLSGGIENGLTYIVTDDQGRKTTQTTSVVFGLDEFDGKDDDYQVPYAKLTLGSDWSIEKGKATATKVQPMPGLDPVLTDTVTIEWDKITCEFPPKDDTPRGVTPSSRAARH